VYPPPVQLAALPCTLQLTSVALEEPSHATAPPKCSAELPEKTQEITVGVDRLLRRLGQGGVKKRRRRKANHNRVRSVLGFARNELTPS
jgi:hypothetical protein